MVFMKTKRLSLCTPASILITLFAALGIASCQTPQSSDSVAEAKISSAYVAQEKISPSNTNFLIQMVDSQLMYIAMGELAEKQGSAKTVKEYGRKLVMDQEVLIEEIRSLAQMNSVILPKEISDDKKEALNKLRSLKGKKFDRKFISLLVQDLNRDLKIFREVKASPGYVNDPAIEAYATTRMPMLQEHLAKVQKLQKRLK